MPASGPLNMGGTSSPVSVAEELGLGLTSTISMDQANVRTLAGVGGSGTAWSMSSLYGKANRASISHTFGSTTANASLNLNSIGGYIAGKSDITVTINGGVYLYCSTSNTGSTPTTPGLNITGGTAGDTLTIVNNGFILGGGGKGGAVQENGIAGGPALSLSYPATINNTNGSAYIAGGGGGGGGMGAINGGGGGGAGGGWGGAPGGAGGGPGAAGAAGTNGSGGGAGGGGCGSGKGAGGGGGGGRILPGSGGAGGSGGGGTGGAGGSANNPGGNGSLPHGGGGGGGGWGASGGNSTGNSSNRVGGAGGRAVQLNGNSVTWVSGNTSRVYGSVS